VQIETVESMEEMAKYLRLLVYGEPGTGKTWFCASAVLDETTSPVMYLNYHGQITSLRSNPKYIKAMDAGRLVILTLGNYNELNRIYSWLFRGAGSSANLDKLFPVFPKTVIVDSITELQRAEVLRIAGNTPGKFAQEVLPPEIQHWGRLLNEFTLLADLFYHLPMHVVFAGLEAVDFGTREVGKPPQVVGYRLALQGQAQRQFPAYALTLMRLDKAARNAKGYNVGYTRSSMAKTKEQSGMLPEKIPSPSIPLLAKMLRGSK